ncbi:cation-transporting P-type ATPase [Patescibacteria group bacterium]|nr:cation-transporting P-type ATPase [Patescibacteria group bacterium]
MIPWAMTPKQLCSEMKTDLTAGLSTKEAEKRLKIYGKNQLPEKKIVQPFVIFFNQIKNPLVYILIAAAILSFVFSDFSAVIIIGLSVVISVSLGFFQEYQAGRSLADLLKVIKTFTHVKRDGEEKELASEFLVPGDIVFLREGEKIAADARLFFAKNLEIDEALLTGESLPIEKKIKVLAKGIVLPDRTNMVFSETTITRGQGLSIVTATGKHSEIGKIAQSLIGMKEESTPLQKKITRFAKWIALIVGILSFLIFLLGEFHGIPFLTSLNTAIAVAVAAIPESLVITVTFILAIGAKRLLKHHALVRKMVAAETLGSVTVICSDKTGTMTHGKMEVAEIVTFDGSEDHESAMRISMLCNEARVENPDDNFSAWRLTGDWGDRALLSSAFESGMRDDYLKNKKKLIDILPFESENKFSAALYKESASQNILYVKGAPEILIKESDWLESAGKRESLTGEKRKKLFQSLEKLSGQGLRVLAVGYKKTGNKKMKINGVNNVLQDIVFVGFIALKDPIRDNVKTTIKAAKKAGIKIVMITGDNKITATAIARELNLPAKPINVLDGEQLMKLTDKELNGIIENITVFARVAPHDKLRIVAALQKKHEIVAVTGDGVNDAPALKMADIGVALGSGQDVSKDASDIVLLDNNFGTIVRAIEEGRVIFDNIKKTFAFLLYDSFTEVFLIGGALLFGLPLPLLATQILWINLVEDALPSFALALEPKEKETMLEKVGKVRELFDRQLKIIIIGFGFISSLLLFGLFLYLLKVSGMENMDYIRTMVFVGLGIDSLFCVFSLRSLRKNIWKINIFSNPFLIGSAVISAIMLVCAIHVPLLSHLLNTYVLSLKDWGFLLAFGFINLMILEIFKRATRRSYKR